MILKYVKKIVKSMFYKVPASYVLMFHHIDDGNLIVKSGCVLDLCKFTDILDSGLSFVSVGEYLTFSHSTKNKCTITFDDGLKDVYRVAYPELKKRGIPFTIFVIVNFLDMEGYISTPDLLEMAQDPLVTIGSHGLTHEVLNGMSYERQNAELVDSKERLEQLIDKNVTLFAYSHGQYDKTTRALLKHTRCYDYAFGVCGYPTNFITKHWKYHLPRINMENNSRNHFDLAR